MNSEQPLTQAEKETIAEHMNVDVSQITEDKDKNVYLTEHINGQIVDSYIPRYVIRYALLEPWA